MSVVESAKRLTPVPVKRAIVALLRRAEGLLNCRRTTQEVFERIYANKKWGESGAYFSGEGSGDQTILDAYCDAVTAYVEREGLRGASAVDLGCGDYSVGGRLRELFGSYTGVDIVPALVNHLNAEHADEQTRFVHKNLIEDDDLPSGDIAFLRQVLQHLSNDQIMAIGEKLARYNHVILTEHFPTDRYAKAKNLDKPHGGDIRLFRGSGVYLDAPPFDALGLELELLAEVPGHGFSLDRDAGVLQTFAVRPKRSAGP
ncbi:MAG: class I SAM-dependent methyltransferase [Planctomycetota bacterium]